MEVTNSKFSCFWRARWSMVSAKGKWGFSYVYDIILLKKTKINMAERVGWWISGFHFIIFYSFLYIFNISKKRSIFPHPHTIMSCCYYCYQKKIILFCSWILGSRIQTGHQNDVLRPSHDVWDLSVEDSKAGVASGTCWNPMEWFSLTCS